MGLADDAKKLPDSGNPAVLGFRRDDDWQKLRAYEPTTQAGRRAIVWVLRMPATFWRVTSGDVELTTGSGDEMGELAERIARAIADGMLAVRGLGRGPFTAGQDATWPPK